MERGFFCAQVRGFKRHPIAKLKIEIIQIVYQEHSVILLVYNLVCRHYVNLMSGE
jgi:hypothetical protein